MEIYSVIYVGDFINFPKKETLLHLCLLLDQGKNLGGVRINIYVHKHILKSSLKRLTSNALRLFNHMPDNVIMHTHLSIWKEDSKKPKEGEQLHNKAKKITL